MRILNVQKIMIFQKYVAVTKALITCCDIIKEHRNDEEK